MNNEKGFTLLELMATILIMGIIMSISLPTFTNSNKNISKKIMYAQFESAFQKTSSDAIAIKKEVKLVLSKKGYLFESEKANKEVLYPNQVSIRPEDIGKEIVFDEEGKVVNSVSFTLSYDNDDYVFQVDTGFQNIKINNNSINEFKKQGVN